MKLVLLGTAGYHPNARRQTACLMLPEAGVILDAGTGMFRVGDQIATDSLDIFLTHAHLDHCIGLTYLFDVLVGRAVDRVTVHGAAEKLAAIQEHLLAEDLFPVKLPCEFRPLGESVELAGGGRLTWFPVIHPGGALGYRLDWPTGSMAYVTDTTAATDADYVEAIRGVDLLVHECNFKDEFQEWAAKTGHSHTTAVAQVAAAAGVGRLVLVHLNGMDESDDPVGIDVARAIFPDTEIGADQMELEF